MQSLGDQLEKASFSQHVSVPDLWQQQAVTALREGRDVVVQAPTGAGKTLASWPEMVDKVIPFIKGEEVPATIHFDPPAFEKP